MMGRLGACRAPSRAVRPYIGGHHAEVTKFLAVCVNDNSRPGRRISLGVLDRAALIA
jgi:hypothetical protein